ncbi:hypothetical protein PPACK8108_LOCUS6261 [Phakopsora pachyrhizi]|uniref:Uncharacterized protein n=1 Tax=Phakopsora pachyrhizi TaxID=170000 RepID=A0AAV0AQK2_PHAPC|nr:hypothetical protein PPACK8108_LOCUS6261 [Phakopsora pachyrhizi]
MPSSSSADQSLLNTLSDTLKKDDFDLAIGTIKKLPTHQRLKLSHKIYNTLYDLATRIHEADQKIAPPRYNNRAATSIELTSLVNYRNVEIRLLEVIDIFQSIGRPISDQQLLHLLTVTIFSASLSLKQSFDYPELKKSSKEARFGNEFSLANEKITRIISKLSALSNKPRPTAEDIALAIPRSILALLSRFYAVFHQPGRGLKTMRKMFYAFLISHKNFQCRENSNLVAYDQTVAIETGSIIISMHMDKIHWRQSALMLAIRMITICGLYPNQRRIASLLRRMYMSRSEWCSVIELENKILDPAAISWLQTQIAIVEAEDGCLERALSISTELLTEAPRENLTKSQETDPSVYSHGICALLNFSLDNTNNLRLSLREAVAIRRKMIEHGIVPQQDSDCLILRTLIHSACKILQPTQRQEFLQEIIDGLFPKDKIFPFQSESSRSFIFASHPGKSPEAFRLVQWLLRWNEIDLSLQVFQSMARYGYVSSFTAVPFKSLKKLLERALYYHPELAMELYQHFHMSGCDPSGILFQLVKEKAIKMGDYRLAEYLLRIKNEQHVSESRSSCITNYVRGFSLRRPTPGNVIRTFNLLERVYSRWESEVEFEAWELACNQVVQLNPLELHENSEVKIAIKKFISLMLQTGHSETDLARIEQRLLECTTLASLIHLEIKEPSQQISSNFDINNQTLSNKKGLVNQEVIDGTYCPQVDKCGSKFSVTLTELVDAQISSDRLYDALGTVEKAVGIDALIKADSFGRLLHALIDKGLAKEALDVNQLWRGMSWRFKLSERGDDFLVLSAMSRICT